MERVLSKVTKVTRYVQMSSSFVGYIHLTCRGQMYVTVPLVHGKGKLDSI